jgi:hypothetical protein
LRDRGQFVECGAFVEYAYGGGPTLRSGDISLVIGCRHVSGMMSIIRVPSVEHAASPPERSLEPIHWRHGLLQMCDDLNS